MVMIFIDFHRFTLTLIDFQTLFINFDTISGVYNLKTEADILARRDGRDDAVRRLRFRNQIHFSDFSNAHVCRKSAHSSKIELLWWVYVKRTGSKCLYWPYDHFRCSWNMSLWLVLYRSKSKFSRTHKFPCSLFKQFISLWRTYYMWGAYILKI